MMSTTQLLEFRELMVAYEVLQNKALDTKLDELKAVLAELQKSKDLETLQISVKEAQNVFLQNKETWDLQVLEDQDLFDKANADLLKKEKEVKAQVEELEQIKNDLSVAKDKFADEKDLFAKTCSDKLKELSIREQAIVEAEKDVALRTSSVAKQEQILADKLNVIKSI